MNGLAGVCIIGTIATRFLCTSWWLAIEFTFSFDVNEAVMTVNDLNEPHRKALEIVWNMIRQHLWLVCENSLLIRQGSVHSQRIHVLYLPTFTTNVGNYSIPGNSLAILSM